MVHVDVHVACIYVVIEVCLRDGAIQSQAYYALRLLSQRDCGCHMPNGCESRRRRHAAMPPPAPVSPSSCCFRRRQRCSQHATDQPEKLPWGLRLRDGLVGLSGRSSLLFIRARVRAFGLSLSPVKRAFVPYRNPTSARERFRKR